MEGVLCVEDSLLLERRCHVDVDKGKRDDLVQLVVPELPMVRPRTRPKRIFYLQHGLVPNSTDQEHMDCDLWVD